MVILEKETHEKFGYYPSKLKRKSHKLVLMKCDDCGKIREFEKGQYNSLCKSCSHKAIHLSDVTRKRISEGQKGRIVTKETRLKLAKINMGKHHTMASRQKMRIANTGEKNGFWGKRHTEGTKQKLRKARKCQVVPTHHTKPELMFESVCKKYNLPFKYTGDGTFWIHNINPDFIECNGKKIAIEIFGEYFHSPLFNYNLKENRTLPYRKKILKRYGWNLIVFWQTDLDRVDAEQYILNILNKRGYV